MEKKKLIKSLTILILAITMSLITGCGSDNGENNGNQTTDTGNEYTVSGKDMSELQTETINGEKVNESIFSEYDVTMVNFWGTYCSPCIAEMPDLGQIYNERKGSNFNIIGIVVDALDKELNPVEQRISQAKSIIDQTGANYEHLLPSVDISENMEVPYQITSIPTTFFVDSNGKVLNTTPYVGSRTKSEWESIIESYL